MLYLSGLSAAVADLLLRVVGVFHPDGFCDGRPRPQPQRRPVAQQSAAEEISNIRADTGMNYKDELGQ